MCVTATDKICTVINKQQVHCTTIKSSSGKSKSIMLKKVTCHDFKIKVFLKSKSLLRCFREMGRCDEL